MYFSFDFKDLANPKKRLLLGILLIVLGVFCMMAKGWYIDVAREDCTSVEAIFDDCKYRSGNHGIEVNSIYLTFDYSSDLDIHPSCASNELTEKLMNLKSGTKMELIVYEKTLTVYEIKVADKIWLAFDDACKKIENNYSIIRYVAYGFLAVGVVFVITFIVSMCFFEKKNQLIDKSFCKKEYVL